MFDIDFIRKSESLKEEIAGGKWNNLPRQKLIERFTKLTNTTPYIFNLETTNACNMQCIMCPRTTKMVRPVQWFPRKLYPAVIEQIIPHPEDKLEIFFDYIENKYGISQNDCSENSFYYYISSRCLTLHGFGEPMLDPHIAKVVSMCTEQGIPTYFSTVAANIKLEKIRRLMNAGLGVLKFSMDALSDHESKHIRGGKNDFTSSMEKIEQVLEHKRAYPQLRTEIVVTMISLSNSEQQNAMEREFLDLWKGKGVFAYIKSQDNRWLYEEDTQLAEIDICTKEYCEYPWTSMSIMADGNVVPCTQDHNCEMVMGNVGEQSLQQIWTGERYRRFRQMHITGKFPEGFKCTERCDQILVADRLKGIKRRHRVI